jgi:predicted pyridoxine 5'-phosphate oxidase superfamily flavin-nucleotide-binding protein
MLAPEVIDCAKRAVLCWLATVDADGVPNVSPKEVWATIGDRHVVVANIASPVSARNIAANAAVCVSFIDVFVQKGFKVKGRGTVVRPGDAEYARWAAPLEEMTRGRFPIRSVIVVEVSAVAPIVAPSYRLYPEETTEASQVEAAMVRYGVRARGGS